MPLYTNQGSDQVTCRCHLHLSPPSLQLQNSSSTTHLDFTWQFKMPASAQTVSYFPYVQARLPSLKYECEYSTTIHHPAITPFPPRNDLHTTTNPAQAPNQKLEQTNLLTPPPHPTPTPPPKERHGIVGRPTARTRPTARRRPRCVRAHPRRECHFHRYRRRGDGDGRAVLRAAAGESECAGSGCVWGEGR